MEALAPEMQKLAVLFTPHQTCWPWSCKGASEGPEGELQHRDSEMEESVFTGPERASLSHTWGSLSHPSSPPSPE